MPSGSNLQNLPDALRCTATVTDKRSKRVGERCLGHRTRNPDGGYFALCSAHRGIPQAAARRSAEDKRFRVLPAGVPEDAAEEERARMIEEQLRRNEEREREREERARAREILRQIEEAEEEAKRTRLTPEQLQERQVAARDREELVALLQHHDPSLTQLVMWIEERQRANDATFESWRASSSQPDTRYLVYPHPHLVGLDPWETARKAVAYCGGLEPTLARMRDANEHHAEHRIDGPLPFPRAGFERDSEFKIVWRGPNAMAGRKPRRFVPIGSADFRREQDELRRQSSSGYPTTLDR